MAALQAVNAIEAERVSAASAEAERERRKAAERKALIETGEAILLDIIVARHVSSGAQRALRN